jgi:hypothetical protein
MTDRQTDILAVLRMQEAALLGVLETVRQAIKTVQLTQPADAGDEAKPGSAEAERRLMNQVLTGLDIQFTSAQMFEQAKKLKPGFKRDTLKHALRRLELSGAIRKIQNGRGMRPASYQKRFYN